jgi:AraC family transcriptional regulator
MQAIGKALRYIESHFDEPLTLDDIAGVSGFSRLHLSRTFAAVVGQTVLAYARGRRLTWAARQLADGAPDILQLALTFGYGSHEAFTRAFREQFGLTPDEVRSRRSLNHLKLVEPVRMPDQPSAVIAPDRFVKTSTMLFAGLRRYFRFDGRAGIPTIWQAFGPMIGTIPDEVRDAALGLILAPAEESDDSGFDYFAAVQVTSLEDPSKDLSGARVGGREWAILKHAGHVSSVGMTCGAAGDWLPHSGLAPKSGPMTLLEHYGVQFDSRTGLGGCEVWLPVQS